MRALYVLAISLLLTGCGIRGKWSGGITRYRCNDGHVIDTREWRPYVGLLGGHSWLQNDYTGEQLTLRPSLECWPDGEAPKSEGFKP